MLHKLTAKVQKLNSNLPATSTGFSNAFVIEPEDKETLDRRGTVYTLFDIFGSEEFDTALVSRIVNDVLRDSYYQSENISPIQSLEKAIVEVRDRVTKLTNESIRLHDATVEFNILSGVLWGNVLYVVSYGDSASFLMREGQIKPINANSEGHFSAASGVIKDDDVVVLSTKPFIDFVSPDQLLTSSVPSTNLPPRASAIVMKVLVDAAFTENEVVDFGVKDIPAKKPLKNIVGGIFSHLKKVPKAPESPVQSEQPVQPTSQLINIKFRKGVSKKKKITSIISIAAILLVVSIFVTLKKNRQVVPASSDVSDTPNPSEVFEPAPAPKAEPVVIDTSFDEKNKVQRVSPEVFYDIKLADPTTNPTKIEIADGTILVSDPALKKTYTSDLTTPKFVPSDKEYVDKGVSGTYLGNTYTLSGDTITKKTSDGIESTWAQNAALEGGRSMAIDMAIYILKADGTLIKFLRGTQETFTVSGLDGNFVSPTQVVTDYDFSNIYVADTGNKRVVVLNKQGALVKQYLNNDTEAWADIKGISVSSDEKTLYVLSGSQVFILPL